MLRTPLSLFLLALVSAVPAWAATDGIQLGVSRGLTEGEVRLDWSGGLSPYAVFRSSSSNGLTAAGNQVGQTPGSAWLDFPPAGTLFFYAVTGSCVPATESCDGVDNDCDGWVDEGCMTDCVDHADCAPEEFCGPDDRCLPDLGDGATCADAAQCASEYCSNGFCCASGTCCAVDLDCAAVAQPPVCDDATSCQGTRVDGSCSVESRCEAQVVDDDWACDPAIESQSCGLYPSVRCTGEVDQPSDQAALCPTSCGVDGDCDPGSHCDLATCIPDLETGVGCDEPTDCLSGNCVDEVCCVDACAGLCASCALPGFEGTCTLVPSGSDPDNECGYQSCGGYYWGWTGDTCYRRADVSASFAACDGAGACRTASEECSLQGQGPSAIVCDSLCQDPAAGSCAGTTPGSCVDVDQGNQSCGTGICETTVPRCLDGSPNVCVPGSPLPESCNDLDDDCDGTVDDGPFQDGYEPNGGCASFATLPTVGSNQTQVVNALTVYGWGDHDYFRVHANETDSSCSCCDLFCTDEDFRLIISLTVPDGAGSYWFCTGQTSCGNVDTNCQQVLAGQTRSWTYVLDGACPASDAYDVYLHIYGGNAPGYECAPYTLSYRFEPGCF